MPNAPLSPVNESDQLDAPKNVLAICLSGGGYRAMLFHTGALWRLLELGYLGGKDVHITKTDGTKGVVPAIAKISSVSGGTITSAALGLAWKVVDPSSVGALDRFKDQVVIPIRKMAATAIAGRSLSGASMVIKDILLPGSVSEHIEAAYASHLYGHKTLQDLPDQPAFVFNASNLQSGALWRFQKKAMRDYMVGQVKSPTLAIAKAVAASSAFPPVLAPCVLDLAPGQVIANDPASPHPDPLFHEPYTTKVLLADGGVYDNLGLETAYKGYASLLVSNAGAPFHYEPKVSANWLKISMRCLDLMDRQVGALRTRLLIDNFRQGARQGAFWAINTDPNRFTCTKPYACNPARTAELAGIPTDLDAKSDVIQERLINWGYAAADLAIRTHLDTAAAAPTLPYPHTVI